MSPDFPQSRMSITIDVCLMSGRAIFVEADLDSRVQMLKQRAQSALGVGKGLLLDSSGGVLADQATLEKAGLQSGQSLTLHIRKVQVCSMKRHVNKQTSCAAILGDGSVVTWGYVDSGGESTAVQDQLKNVQQIQTTGEAFAAILSGGSVGRC